ncbi:Retrotransposon-derived protein PEG10 [Crotalus adamanteus]|uniref:Retrotransposon-derived protein PEG10 n=1 Tax=Crotalus adamanteus TaxID=8729 RepID=A0AAW1C5X7_CROAD
MPRVRWSALVPTGCRRSADDVLPATCIWGLIRTDLLFSDNQDVGSDRHEGVVWAECPVKDSRPYTSQFQLSGTDLNLHPDDRLTLRDPTARQVGTERTHYGIGVRGLGNRPVDPEEMGVGPTGGGAGTRPRPSPEAGQYGGQAPAPWPQNMVWNPPPITLTFDGDPDRLAVLLSHVLNHLDRYFLDALRTRFEDPTRLQWAEAQLVGLRQRGRPAKDYIRGFQKLAGRLRSWPDRLLVHHFRNGLDNEIRRACIVRGIGGRLTDWFKAAMELDIGLREHSSGPDDVLPATCIWGLIRTDLLFSDNQDVGSDRHEGVVWAEW